MTEGARIGFIGGGTMAGGLIKGLIQRGGLAPAEIVVCEPVAARRDQLLSEYGVSTTAEYGPALAARDAVVIAVKPQDFPKAAAGMRSTTSESQLYISIMAGVRLERISVELPGGRAVRVMPNLGVTVGEAYSMWIGEPGVTETDRALVRRLLGAAGREHEAPAEGYLDMTTAVAGSGPGYVTLLIEGLIDGAVQIGLPRVIATEMVMQTVLGTVRWAQEDGGHPAVLRAQVVSPGGTTAEGVYALERGGVRAALIAAVIAGYEKSRSLGA